MKLNKFQQAVMDAVFDCGLVVRCKDCKYRDEEIRDESTKWLPCMAIKTEGNWFCADGERRDDVESV